MAGKHAAKEALLRVPRGGLNVAGLRAVVAQIYLDPAAWNQNTFFGASPLQEGRVAYCLAAWTCLLVGIDVESLATSGHEVHRLAREMLGLTHQQANQIFWWGVGEREHPTVEDLKARITEVTGVLFDSAELTFAAWADQVLVPA